MSPRRDWLIWLAFSKLPDFQLVLSKLWYCFAMYLRTWPGIRLKSVQALIIIFPWGGKKRMSVAGCWWVPLLFFLDVSVQLLLSGCGNKMEVVPECAILFHLFFEYFWPNFTKFWKVSVLARLDYWYSSASSTGDIVFFPGHFSCFCI